jgi:CheY-like chemotaxis protein/predicted regulator of Ras-like GTPase activity (Roadblock/LC7/MglB family)
MRVGAVSFNRGYLKEHGKVAQYSVLITDSDPEILQHLSGTLKANGFNTTSTSSGADALDLYKKEPPDLVIADQAIFEMDGMQLLEELRAYDPNARVILTSTSASKEMIARGFRLGALDILEKPVNSEFLITKIRDFLAREDRALEGNLGMMSLASIIQINCEERNQAKLTLNHLGQDGTIYFRDGEIIHAESAGLMGEEVVYFLLNWEVGTFQLKMGVEPRQRTIKKPWSGLLLEGMRRIDEITAGWNPDGDDEKYLAPEEEENTAQLQERIVKAITNIRDVESAVICSADGKVIAQDKSKDPESDAELGRTLIEQAELIRGFLEGGPFERAIFSGSDNRFYIQQTENNHLCLSLSKRSSAETVFKSVETVQKRYQSS